MPSAPPTTLHLVLTRKGAVNVQWKGDVAVRVYKATGVADQFRAAANKCDFLTEGPLVARGVARFELSDADDSTLGPGAYQWGWVLRGALENVAVDGCGSQVQLFMVRRWVQKQSVDMSLIKLTASKGPLLDCR